MGWIGCVRCKKSRSDFVARTFALIAPVHPVCTEFHAITKRSQIHPNTTKQIETLVYGPMGWIGCVRGEKSRRDFVARTFALIALVHAVLHQVSCNYEMIPNAPKHYETHQNKSLGSNVVDPVRSLRKNPTPFRGTNFCTSSARFTRVS